MRLHALQVSLNTMHNGKPMWLRIMRDSDGSACVRLMLGDKSKPEELIMIAQKDVASALDELNKRLTELTPSLRGILNLPVEDADLGGVFNTWLTPNRVVNVEGSQRPMTWNVWFLEKDVDHYGERAMYNKSILGALNAMIPLIEQED